MLYRTREEEGFSLIELMVVVLIIGILIAIALPTFLGARKRAAERAVQTSMRTGLAAGLAYYAEQGNWDGFDATQAETEEPSLQWVDGPAAPQIDEVSVHVHTGQELLIVAVSSTSEYFCLAQLATSPSTGSGRGSTFDDVDTVLECTTGW